ncbi:unnamed protein product [Prunus brigantina]
MLDCNPVHNPIVPGFKLTKDFGGERIDSTYYKQIVGSLMYLSATRPDMMFVISLLSRFMEAPTILHFQAAKRVLHYLKGTTDFGVLYKRGKSRGLARVTVILLGTWMIEKALQVKFSCLVLGQFLGLQRSSRWSRCPQLKLSFLQLLPVHVKLCG